MNFLLDTNVVSEVRKPRPHGAVLSWLRERQEQQLFISAVSLGEIQRGIERIRRQDAARAQVFELWLDGVLGAYQVLPMDTACFREWGRLMDQKHDGLSEDGMIAATARVHGLIVVTRNERDFKHFDVPILNPFKTT